MTSEPYASARMSYTWPNEHLIHLFDWPLFPLPPSAQRGAPTPWKATCRSRPARRALVRGRPSLGRELPLAAARDIWIEGNLR